MRPCKRLLLAMLVVWAAKAWGAPDIGPQPYIGYAYPAGGQQGTVVSVTIGGENLKDAGAAYISGEGVSATVTGYEGPFGVLTQPQYQELRTRLQERREQIMAEQGGNAARPEKQSAAADAAKANAAKRPPVALPDLPELQNIDQMNLRDLKMIQDKFIKPARTRAKPPIAEQVILQVTIAPGAAPGDREIRLRTPNGITNPRLFQVGRWTEARKPASDDLTPVTTGPTVVNPAVDLPVVLNGQIMPGQVDRWLFRARQGQKLVIAVHARRLIPYLADAVPGWFQAVAALYDAKGNQLAVADHYRFDPDPVIFYEAPADGECRLEIYDSLYRGRPDFVYRVSVGEQPFITQMFPLGGRVGAPTVASIAGVNLPEQKLQLDTQPGAKVRSTAWRGNGEATNEVAYAVDALPECDADAGSAAQRITLPQIINGRIAHPGDTGMFRFDGRAGEDVVAEVYARRLGSPLDSLLRLTDATGHVLAWNDDFEDPAAGLLTHQADSYLRARLPADGTYEVHLSDAQNEGSEARVYRLRISAPQPDFELFVTPSGINVPAGHAVPICFHAVRRDGFDGDIEVALKGGPKGFSLAGARIPSGRDHVYMTLAAPRPAADTPVALQFEGRALIGGTMVVRPAAPADEMMQAFAYWHLVPAQELLVSITGFKRWQPVFALAGNGPVRLPAGGTAQVRVIGPARAAGGEVKLELSEPPKGVTLADVAVVQGGLEFTLKAAADAPAVGYADNLIVEASAETAAGRAGTPAANQKRRVFVGVLPAIPFEVVRP